MAGPTGEQVRETRVRPRRADLWAWCGAGSVLVVVALYIGRHWNILTVPGRALLKVLLS